MTIAQQWQMVAPPTATPPTTCHATVASIKHSPQTPPQGEAFPALLFRLDARPLRMRGHRVRVVIRESSVILPRTSH